MGPMNEEADREEERYESNDVFHRFLNPQHGEAATVFFPQAPPSSQPPAPLLSALAEDRRQPNGETPRRGPS
jgi:hypothetical protein